MSFHQLPSSSPAAGGGLGRVMSVVLGLLVWAMLAMLGLVFAASLAIWLVVMVVVSLVSELHDPADSSKKYTTTWFDMFRIENGKIVEHWDSAARLP